jgi:hypothetical protein
MLGMSFGMPLSRAVHVAQPDFLYKEQVFTAGIGTCGTEKNLS